MRRTDSDETRHHLNAKWGPSNREPIRVASLLAKRELAASHLDLRKLVRDKLARRLAHAFSCAVSPIERDHGEYIHLSYEVVPLSVGDMMILEDDRRTLQNRIDQLLIENMQLAVENEGLRRRVNDQEEG